MADELQHILGNLFISKVSIPEAGLLTVTQVEITNDLKLAKVYISFLENKKPINDILAIIDSKQNVIRCHIGKKLKLKYIPLLRFYYDNTLEKAERIEILIENNQKID